MVDDRKLIDAGTWDFIRETEIWVGPDPDEPSVAEQRRRYGAKCRPFSPVIQTG